MRMRRFYLPVILGVLITAFWLEPDIQEIAAGVAIFLFGMLMLEDGFRLFSGGLLERLLERATRSTPRALLLGFVSATVLQSSSLVSVIAISFLSAGLITLLGGLGIVFGANVGTTTGAWLIAGFGLKVNIAAYAMPMLALSIVLVFQKSKVVRGIGYALGGLGFLFLGIHYMKGGFESFKEQIDLTRYAMGGVLGLIVYTAVGAVATALMQSSHATLVLVITALGAGQITYDNAIALAIGANIGTTITAIIGSLTSNYLGRRLALGDFLFKFCTAIVALILFSPLRDLVDRIAQGIGLAADDYTLRLAVFHTIFNVLGVMLVLPVLNRLIGFLTRTIPEPETDISRPRYLSEAADEFPQTLETALRKEVWHLYENAVELILHGLNLHRHTLYQSGDIAATVRASHGLIEMDLDADYEHRVKTLYSAIVDFSGRAGARRLPPGLSERLYALRDVASNVVQAVKSVKHLRKNVNRFTTGQQGPAAELYDGLRTELARIVVEIRRLEQAAPEDRSALWLDQEWAQVAEDSQNTTRRVDALIREQKISADVATSFLNDATYAYGAMRDLINAARAYFIERDEAMAEVERLLALDDEEIEETLTERQGMGGESS